MNKTTLLLGVFLICLGAPRFSLAADNVPTTANDTQKNIKTRADQIYRALKTDGSAGIDISGKNNALVAETAHKLAIIYQYCAASERKCLNTLERYYRENQEHSATSGFLGLFQSLNFWGAAQETHYTEVELPIKMDGETSRIIEYQVGVGYQMAARQSDANMKGEGFLASLPAAITGKTGGTRFWAMIIGLAPDGLGAGTAAGRAGNRADDGSSTGDNAADSDQQDQDNLRQTCENTKDDNPAGALVCTLDMQPAVTQRYFRDTSARIAEALDRVRRTYRRKDFTRPAGQTSSSVCPQVIDFRYKTAQLTKIIAPNNVTESMRAGALAINKILSEICANTRPNAKLVYRDGTAFDQWKRLIEGQFAKGATTSAGSPPKSGRKIDGSISAALGDGGVSADRKSIGQEYQRSHYYLALSSKTAPTFIAPEYDRGLMVSMEGLTKSVKVPSILASIVSYQRNDLSQYLSVKLKCGGGTAEFAGSENPVANAVAYANLLEGLRKAIDANTAPMTDAHDTFDTRCEISKVNARYDRLDQTRPRESEPDQHTRSGETQAAPATRTPAE